MEAKNKNDYTFLPLIDGRLVDEEGNPPRPLDLKDTLNMVCDLMGIPPPKDVAPKAIPAIPPMPAGVVVGTKQELDMEIRTVGAVSFLVQIITRVPDAIRPRGADFEYKSNGNSNHPPTPNSGNSGRDIPAGFIRPLGYRIVYFPDKKTDEDYYYQYSTKPDEVFVEPVATVPVPKLPDTPKTDNNSERSDWQIDALFSVHSNQTT